ncbi:MAG: hypothetical protein MZV63_13265 [Marinilabiliales bacterium]|nr:hypothetical protein [Marinilabiliales bacterium]
MLEEQNIEFIVLARYMQILSSGFVSQYPNRIINIHHSFLPAFAGAKPYHAAHAEWRERSSGPPAIMSLPTWMPVPIIEQDVTRCSHMDTVENLIRKGRDLEKIVLSQAVLQASSAEDPCFQKTERLYSINSVK